jgi:hypothetical protein
MLLQKILDASEIYTESFQLIHPDKIWISQFILKAYGTDCHRSHFKA